ncbi:ABC transporter ATP-binding protein [Desulfitobacterium hafniense]|uniref:ABC transporter domain-containing protein n=4 Tax=root TaxID=1 RepID=Q24YG8_DESHY|nr:ABC transporter ATP-binding protein [Desulfitobacterium hafniense]EHL05682.1 ABC transporter, ATP-binding protein [Desulfitobacterium hafniense DP7]KTE90460.1 iron ABC transporter ATP-binding protein [Desulfitobacterium hafniense]MEA5021733.1 ABC transporter ATP-binding protein [Desulfitobacterium hafniense]CDX01058.1 Fe(3+) dicitrate transport ATP-binding protein FecE [Desulfitobacterium hafniense]BAE82924.1 hypothetical protein DSY1135 [Desulfitobacterium hafniense Y51]
MNSLLEVNQAAFAYPSGKTVFKDVNFTISPGQILSIIGPNGAGKSTLLNCIAGFNTLDRGNIRIEGIPLPKMNRKAIARYIGYVPQIHNPAYGYSIRDFVVMGRAPYISTFRMPGREDFAKADAAIAAMGISHLAQRPYTDVSGGERQQATIARVIVQEPQIIMLDEPTSALDFGNQLRTVRMIKELAGRGYAIIMTTHNPDQAMMLEGQVGILEKNGRFSVGKAQEIINEETLTELYQTEVKIPYVEQISRNACLARL